MTPNQAQMQTAGVEQVEQRLRRIDTDLTSTWGEQQGIVRDTETAAIGTGRLAGAIHSRYDIPSGRTRVAADRLPYLYTELGAAAGSCAQDYSQADARGREKCVYSESRFPTPSGN